MKYTIEKCVWNGKMFCKCNNCIFHEYVITISQSSSAKKEDEEKPNTDEVKNENGPEVNVAAENEADKADCWCPCFQIRIRVAYYSHFTYWNQNRFIHVLYIDMSKSEQHMGESIILCEGKFRQFIILT